MNINELLNGMDRESMRQISDIANTPAGRELMKKIKSLDKDELMKSLNSLNSGSAPRMEVLKQVTNDPALIRKLNDFLDRR